MILESVVVFYVTNDFKVSHKQLDRFDRGNLFTKMKFFYDCHVFRSC